MKPHINVITFAVEDLERALKFYSIGLGLATEGIVGSQFRANEEQAAGDVVMFDLDGGLVLALYPRTELAKDAQIPFQPAKTGEFSIGHFVGEEGTCYWIALTPRAQPVTDPAHDRPWGHLLRLLPRSGRPSLADHLQS
jgi:catechol 2,3-dioxygenase-like lactoylglutathione lyase family enzyme